MCFHSYKSVYWWPMRFFKSINMCIFVAKYKKLKINTLEISATTIISRRLCYEISSGKFSRCPVAWSTKYLVAGIQREITLKIWHFLEKYSCFLIAVALSKIFLRTTMVPVFTTALFAAFPTRRHSVVSRK